MKAKLLTKQLVVAKSNLTLEANFLIFFNDELTPLFNLEEKAHFKKIQKWIYENSRITSYLKRKFTTFPLKVLSLQNGLEFFSASFLNPYFKLLLIKYGDLFIQIKKLSCSSFFYIFLYKKLYVILFVIIKLFILKKCILS